MERSDWHPLVASPVVGPGAGPHAVTLMGTALVVWRDTQGQVHVWQDRCPHRGAKLSMGRVTDDRLECPYHGWQFGTDGHCKLVPVDPQFVAPPSHCVVGYPAREAYGLVWTCLGNPSGSIPEFVEEDDHRLRKVLCGPYDVQASAPRIVENFLDMAHFGFVHENWLGDRAHAEMPSYQVAESDQGFVATQCFAWQPRSSIHATTGSMVEYTYRVSAPYTAILTKIPEATSVGIADFSEAIALFVLPVSQEVSRVWIRMAMTDFESPDHTLTDFQDVIFSQDQPILESQQPKCLPLYRGAEVHGPADRSSSAYRRYLQRSGVSYGVLREEPKT